MTNPIEYLEFDNDGKTIARCKENVSEVIIPDGVEEISEEAFMGLPITSIVIPNSVTYIGDSAFEGCTKLKSVTFPESKLYIADNAFWGCVSLKEVIIPDGTYSIGACAFRDCTSLTTFTAPTSAKESFNDYFDDLVPFYGCTALTYVTVPCAEYLCFENLPKLKLVNLLDGYKEIQDCTFSECPALEDVNIPASVTSIYLSAKNCDNLKSINVSEENQNYLSVDGALYSKDGKEMLAFPCKYDKETFVIPEGVETLEECTWLSEEYTTVKSISIPSTLVSHYIKKRAFPNLQNIYVAENNTEFKSVDGLFYSKDGSVLISYPEGRIGDSFYVPQGVEAITDSVYSRFKKLVDVYLPSSVKRIGFMLLDEILPSALLQKGNMHFHNGEFYIGEEKISLEYYEFEYMKKLDDNSPTDKPLKVKKRISRRRTKGNCSF